MIIDYGERIKERIENAYLPLTRLNLTMIIFSIIHFPSALQFLYAYLSFYLVSLQSWREGNYRIMCSALWRGRLRLRDGLYLEQDRVSREWGPQSTEPRHTLRAGLVISSRLILFLTSQVLTHLVGFPAIKGKEKFWHLCVIPYLSLNMISDDLPVSSQCICKYLRCQN